MFDLFKDGRYLCSVFFYNTISFLHNTNHCLVIIWMNWASLSRRSADASHCLFLNLRFFTTMCHSVATDAAVMKRQRDNIQMSVTDQFV